MKRHPFVSRKTEENRPGLEDVKSDEAAAIPLAELSQNDGLKKHDDELKKQVSDVDVEKPASRRGLFSFFHTEPMPPADSLDDAQLIPDVGAGLLSSLLMGWLGPILKLGYIRPLVATDLYKIDEARKASTLGAKLIGHFERRQAEATEWNRQLTNGEYRPSRWRRLRWRAGASVGLCEADGRRSASLFWALSDTFFVLAWSNGFLILASVVIDSFMPLLIRRIISYGQVSYGASHGVEGDVDPGVGLGAGLAVGMFVLVVIQVFCFSHYFFRTSKLGVFMRTALISAIYAKAVRLSGKSRMTLDNSKLISMISTDVSRIDICNFYAHQSWVGFVQLVILVIILCVTLGYSALPGIALIFLIVPVQRVFIGRFLVLRKAALVWTDRRVKLTQELVNGIKLVKTFAWEKPMLEALDEARAQELKKMRKLLFMRAANSATALSTPVIAAVVSLTCYTLTHRETGSALIFSSFSLFLLLKSPMMGIPMSLGMAVDALAALGRLQKVFEAETLDEVYDVDPSCEYAIQVVDGTFRFESRDDQPLAPAAPIEAANKASPAAAGAAGIVLDDNKLGVEQMPPPPASTHQLRNINLQINRGQLVAVVGSVGAGKSALLQALLGEMKRVSGSVKFGGSVGYCAQQAWVLHGTLKENVLFGQPYDEARYRQVIRDACLEADLDMLPYRDETQIGEKGITLSGGQKQRINIARALYFNSDIVLYDDPLSAVDAHVGKHLFEHAIKAAHGKTRVLVTHALHFLPQVDYIYCLDHGDIAEHGTYANLTARHGAFSRLMAEFGGEETKEEQVEIAKEQDAIDGVKATAEQQSGKHVLMQEEERLVGSVSGRTWVDFYRAANGNMTVTSLIFVFIIALAGNVMSSYTLVWWQEATFGAGWTDNDYMALFAGLSVLAAVFTFLFGCASVVVFNVASRSLHNSAIRSVVRSPTSFFDTTPVGRIMARFTKDLDTLDNTQVEAFRLLMNILVTVFSTVILILIVQRWFLIALAVVGILYVLTVRYYRQTSREIKRLDNLLRSGVYGHFSESLSGLSTIRAYGLTDSFVAENQRRLDISNRAYFLSIAVRSWLNLRLDMYGSTFTFSVALVAIGLRNSLSPAQIGVSLAYVLSINIMLTFAIRQFTEVENDMNSVERLLYYSNELQQEAPRIVEGNEPPADWPAQGAISFTKVLMSYRPGLPPVLKGVSMDIKAGEKIGLVGRTGSGKSSTMVALFRMVELLSGTITIDGVDISQIGLETLRSRLSLIPQDPLLFQGTIRSNLDPFGEFDDAKLNDALRRAWLVDPAEPADKARFTLSTVIEDEGLNLSVGERSLVSLARALVRDAQIVLLDEATASVDFETDAKIQQTIATEFRSKTMITIAHRLLTILSCDRICVMDAGRIAEMDAPEELFVKGGIFRSMCDQSNLSLAHIRQARAARDHGQGIVLREEVE